MEAMSMFARLGKDLVLAVRTLSRSPSFTLVSILVLAIAIGLNTTMFSVVDALLLRDLPYREPDRLITVWTRFEQMGFSKFWLSGPELRDLQRQEHLFSASAAYFHPIDANLNAGGEAERVQVAAVSATLFPVLGARPAEGRVFAPQEDQPGGPDVAVLSHSFWQRRFGRDPGVVGRRLELDAKSFEVVGVMPPDFAFPDPEIDLWVPLALDPADPGPRESHFLRMVARLANGMTPEAAQSEVSALASRLQQEHPESYKADSGWGLLALPLKEHLVGDLRPTLRLLAGAVFFVLLIACANVANLQLVRTQARRQEIALRSVLGASRASLLRLLLSESILLGLLGGGAGLLLALAVIRAVAAYQVSVLRGQSLELDVRVLAFTLLASVAAGALVGLVATLRWATIAPREVLAGGGQRGSEGVERRRLRGGLVIAEFALALLLLVGAGLMIQSLLRLRDVDPGFQPEGVLTGRISLSSRYQEAGPAQDFFAGVLAHLRGLPGVESVAAVSKLPLAGSSDNWDFAVEGRPQDPGGVSPNADYRAVTTGYFETLSVPLLAGRTFHEFDREGQPGVVVVNETLARRFWSGDSPIGRRIRLLGGGKDLPWLTVVGVVGDIRGQSLAAEPRPEIYLPSRQMEAASGNPPTSMTLLVRTRRDPEALVSALRDAVARFDPTQPVYDVQPLDRVVAASTAQAGFLTSLLTLFAGVALILAALGIYGVISYSVRLRTRELGIRLALGATRREVLALVLKEGLLFAGSGVAAGLLLAFLLSRLLSSLVFGVSLTDPATFAIMPAVLILVAFLSVYLPARRATRVDPMLCLRAE
jgi:putative ABC transport system permease protein